MTQGNLTNFSLSQSGQPFAVPNGANGAAGSSLTVSYTISGSPASMSIFIEGLKTSAGGAVALLDTYASTSNVASRSISLSDSYDSFRFSGIWGSTPGVSVACAISASGPGLSWNSGTLPAVQNRSF
jgi:hypothetical protein